MPADVRVGAVPEDDRVRDAAGKPEQRPPSARRAAPKGLLASFSALRGYGPLQIAYAWSVVVPLEPGPVPMKFTTHWPPVPPAVA
jgi:hypothetical protein